MEAEVRCAHVGKAGSLQGLTGVAGSGHPLEGFKWAVIWAG